MAFKFIVFAAFVAVVRGGVVAPVAPVALAKFSTDTFDPNPQYSFAYDVQDAITGDSKSQVESRSGNIVQGQYTVADPDGTRRIVDYVADPINGFNAVVRKTPLAVASPVVARAAPVIAAPAPVVPAPAVARVAAPFAAPFVGAPALARLAAPAAPLVAAPAPFAPALPAAYAAAAPLTYPGLARVAAPYTYAAL